MGNFGKDCGIRSLCGDIDKYLICDSSILIAYMSVPGGRWRSSKRYLFILH